ncbi:AAA family ATPase [Nocardia cyriacigeorgica]|uniref:AAA family ATPase n=1 Tax=Nocardia cyriacigeorgica TaxID=135487 RepID=UPI002455DA4A|nr:AAA family ATPase [Nocardia cyriacigeorgica]
MTITNSAGITITDEFADALTRLHRGDNLFLTGKAGTGKSTLIREFLAATDRTVVVAAPTGIAALNVGGQTIHSLFSFRPETRPEEVQTGRYYPARSAEILRKLDTLIIDEASMVRADLFDMVVAALERFGPRRGVAFGGVQIVLVGDLFQLPPVVQDSEKEYFATRYTSPYFFSADSYQRELFPTVELTRVFRQVGDQHLLELLNGVRSGTLAPDLLTALNARTDPEFRPPVHEFWLTLTTTNRSADCRNREQLGQLATPEIRHRAVQRGELEGFTTPTEEELVYKVGAQIMLLTNDPIGRWVNGTIGEVVEHRIEDGAPVVGVKLPSGARVQVRPHTWEVTRPVVTAGSLHYEVVGSFTQLPFRLAWAITIHKSQGQTLNRLVVDLTGGTFADGQLYVALSRCTSMDGLVLRRPVAAKDLKTDLRVRRFLEEGKRPADSYSPVYFAVCTVGSEALYDKPRPIEIALITEDGTEISTLINPERDLEDARRTYGITATDVQLAPTLAVAWAALTSHLAGRTPVGVDVDRHLRYIDTELKRADRIVAMPIGLEQDLIGLSQAELNRLDAPRAIDRARAIRDFARRRPSPPSGATAFPSTELGTGYLLSRGGAASCFRAGGRAPGKTDEQVLAEHLRGAAAKVRPDEDTRALLRELEIHLGHSLLDTDATPETHDIVTILVPGARICFTGTAIDDTGTVWARSDLEALAEKCGLEPVKTVTRKKCEALIAAEIATQSGKGKQAVQFGKPIFTAQQFLEWANTR